MKITTLLKAEYVKGKHSFIRRLLFMMPLLCVFLAIFLMGGNRTQLAIYNWWYTILLPAMVSLICINLISIDKKSNFVNIYTIPISNRNIWISKSITGFLYLLLSNIIIFFLCTIVGFLFNYDISFSDNLLAMILLTILYLWQIPLGMYITAKFNSITTFLILVVFNILGSIKDVAASHYWFIPFSIPSRIMAVILGINPNGLPLPVNSSLRNHNVILPALIISISLLVLISLFTSKWFDTSNTTQS